MFLSLMTQVDTTQTRKEKKTKTNWTSDNVFCLNFYLKMLLSHQGGKKWPGCEHRRI